MKVSTTQPFKLIYSIFAHEFLGYLFESFVIQVNTKGELTFVHQNISHLNMEEFADGLDATDYRLIELMDSIQQDVVVHKFHKKKMNATEFFLKVYDKEKGNKDLQKEIEQYIDEKKAKILPLLKDKSVYVMGEDGEPAGRPIEMCQDPASIWFHFHRNEDSTHYYPTIKHGEGKVQFQYNKSQVLCNDPGWLLIGEQKIMTFEPQVLGTKLKPFLNKNHIVIPRKVEETYFQKFVTPLVASHKVIPHGEGLEIIEDRMEAKPILRFRDLSEEEAKDMAPVERKRGKVVDWSNWMLFELYFQYGAHIFPARQEGQSSVKLERTPKGFLFHKIHRSLNWEHKQEDWLNALGLELDHGRSVMEKSQAFDWLKVNQVDLANEQVKVEQEQVDGPVYFLGRPTISVEVREKRDWFDIHAVVKFGEFEIPFLKLRDLVLKKKYEFLLPDGRMAVIPESWLKEYSELLQLSELSGDDEDMLRLHKHHMALVKELERGKLAKVEFDKKLEGLRDFQSIEDYALPKGFKGTLRPYQKAGYNWLRFLSTYGFGGCLADDMGLGKTVQTLALLQHHKEEGGKNASLLVMPTSLVYNWEKEAQKFAPDLKVLVYTGTYRDKNVEQFEGYDVVLTSYGIVRLDVDLLKTYEFNYIILDESQAIKNPTSHIAKAVKELDSSHRMVLTGTPVENSTMDLWSQMNFVNPGLLGSKKFFKDSFQTAIEKKNDEEKRQRLHAIIKPFILRRQKSQVLTELPKKVEQIWYSSMTKAQSKEYERTKSYYRNKILEEMEEKGVSGSQITILQGLTKLRQLANHPRLADQESEIDSGKLDDVMERMEEAIVGEHKILVFSQFVKHLGLVREHLDEKGIKYAYLDGSTKDRQKEVERFQADESIRVFLISLKAGGLGLNLTAADYVFILDPWWNPAIENQAVDRAHRMGQKNTVHTYKFITKDTVEEKILRLQASKKALANDLITAEESFVKSLSREDIADILA